MTDRVDTKKFEDLLGGYGDLCYRDGRCHEELEDMSPEIIKAWKAVFDAYTALAAENERLRGLLKEAQPYVRAGYHFDYDNELADNLAASSLLAANIAAALEGE